MGDDYELKNKIEIPLDKRVKLIIEPNHGQWDEDVFKDDGIYFAIGENKDDDDRKWSEISLSRLEDIGYQILSIVSKIYERL